MKVSASFLSSDFKPIDLIKKINNTSADFLHVDVMDGAFTENKTYTLGEIKKFSDITNKKLDVHLMVNKPLKYVEELSLLNTEYITFHYEAVKNIDELIDNIKNYGVRVGISINPETDVSVLFSYLNKIDQVLIMSVKPGKSGQEFIEGILYKIEVLSNEIKKNNYKTIISVDGGINESTSLLVHQSGANMVVTASFIHNDEMVKRVEYLKNI